MTQEQEYDELLTRQGRDWRIFLDMADDGDVDLAARVVEAAEEWLAARMATLAEPVADVRTSTTFSDALTRLANAEAALVAAVKSLQEG